MKFKWTGDSGRTRSAEELGGTEDR